MTALTEERHVVRVGSEVTPARIHRKMAASVKILKGALVANAAGYATPFTTATTHKVFGVALETVDNTAGSAGAKNVPVERGVFPFVNSSAGDAIAQADVGKLCYGVDDQTVALTDGGGTRSIAGIIEGFEGTAVLVRVGCDAVGDDWLPGTALTDVAATTVQRVGRRTSYLLAGTMSQGETITLGTTGAQKGDMIRIIRTSTSAQTAAIVNGGAGAGTLVTLPASKVNFAEAQFDGTNWLFQACGTQ